MASKAEKGGSKRFLNSPTSYVDDMLVGLLAATPCLQRLELGPEARVVVDASPPAPGEPKVAVISGGGSGHEPAHGGFVGRAMLSAAVAGDVFASPPSHAVLAAIRAADKGAGVLLVVKNYTGDRLNFGLAAEEAKAEGRKVEVVVVADDCAPLPSVGIAGRRGIAGTVLVHKVAGAAAEAGMSLQAVKQEAEVAIGAVASMGVATQVCTIPGSAAPDRLPEGEMEVGLGIHGEPGVSKQAITSAKDTVKLLLDQIASAGEGCLGLEAGEDVVVLVNSLGGTPLGELQVVAGEAKAQLEGRQVMVRRLYVGALMTALDMAGFSLSVMRANSQRLARLDAPTLAPAWGPCLAAHLDERVLITLPPSQAEAATQQSGTEERGPADAFARALLERVAMEIIGRAAELDALDTAAGDGDCGTTLAKAARALQDTLSCSIADLGQPLALLSLLRESVRSMGGTSGALYLIALTGAAGSLADASEGGCSLKTWVRALSAALSALTKYSGARQGDRTFLDALIPAHQALKEAGGAGGTAASAAQQAAKAAEDGAKGTELLAAKAGRASYVPEAATRGKADPGAVGVAVWMRAIADSF